VIADGFKVEPDTVHDKDRGFVFEETGQKRARTGEIARRHEDSVRILGPEPLDVRGKVGGTAGGDLHSPSLGTRIDADPHFVGGRDETAAPSGRLQVAVKVIDREDLDVNRKSHEGAR
jgi:hypothetical protein